ncbi:MAG: protein kinase domain-containing protein [Myxococcaceae bacterium]
MQPESPGVSPGKSVSSRSSDWSRIAELVDEGLAMAPAARATWLEGLARREPALAPAVRRLIAARSAEADTRATAPAVDGTAAHRAGERIGPYLLLEPLGSGGMGEVWLARRDDGALRRDVALKLPLLDPARRDVAVRFARERDILARLEHPNIARLYDAGVAQGQPFLAMERVHGRHITAYCDARRIDVEGRLGLFLQVLAAVQSAHTGLVLHRDLKPSNILVTDEGQVRLLDFGVATLLDPDGPARATALTRASGRALTPAYASPEQILGNPLTTASDVYSLGVVLFELLTGARPYELPGKSPAELASAILASQPLRPSDAVSEAAAEVRGTTPAKLRRRLQGDLDGIVLRTLGKQPTTRYPSADALADDLRRSLDRVPLQARAGSRLYRVERFVARHRWVVLGSAAVACALVVSTTAAVVQARRAREEGRLARTEARNARAVRDFLTEVLSSADPQTPGTTPARERSVQQAVDSAAARIGSALEGQPHEKVSVLVTLAGVYSSLDMPDRSIALLQQALEVAGKIQPVPNEEQAAVLTELANVAMFGGRFDQTAGWLDRAEPVFAALGDTTSEEYAQLLKIRGNLVRRGNTPDRRAGAALLERSTALFRERYPDSDGRLGALFYLAQTLRASNLPGRAEAIADEAVTLANRRAQVGFERANAFSLRAVIRDSNGKLAEADQDFGEAAAGYLRTTGPTHFLTVQNDGLRGTTLLEMGSRDDGLRRVEASAEALARGRKGSNTHAQALERVGLAYVRVGRFARAIPILEESRTLWAQRGETLLRVVPTLALAHARAALGQDAAARTLLDEALSVVLGSPRTALVPEGDVHLVRGLIAVDRGETAEAHTALAQALTLSGWETRADLTRRVMADAGRARVAVLAGRGAEAVTASERLLELVKTPALAQVPRVRAVALEARGLSLCEADRAGEGEPMLAESVTLLAQVMDADSVPVARVRLEHARCLLERGQKAEAAALVEEVRRAVEAAGPAGTVLQPAVRAFQEKLAAR